ncbi:MAG TPA: pyridoxamine 5'-phosphate oxidase family protein [Xanthobacteraceae bacterium]
MTAETAQRIIEFLDANYVMSLATSGSCGPHAANVFYARDGLALLWVSDCTTRHSTELEGDPRVAATVAPDCFEFDDIRGVQISGRARLIRDAAERATSRRILEARYPRLKRLSESPAALRDAYLGAAFYRLEPERMVLIDNSRGFGHKETIEL